MKLLPILTKSIRYESDLASKEKRPEVLYRKRSEQDIYFTSNFHRKAKEWGLTEAHARRVYYEGDRVKGKGKENMKVMTYRGEEIGIYAFHDRETNQPVVTSIWKRKPRATPSR